MGKRQMLMIYRQRSDKWDPKGFEWETTSDGQINTLLGSRLATPEDFGKVEREQAKKIYYLESAGG